MKKSLVARGFMGAVASLLGVSAVGCSSEPLSPEEAAEIGVSEQAIVRTTSPAMASLASATLVDGTTDITDPVERQYAASCVITEGGVDKILLAGGFDEASGAALSDAYVYIPSSNTWERVAAMPDARGQAKLIKLGADRCLLVGGSTAKNGGTMRTATYVFDGDGGEGSWGSSVGTITGRVNHAAFACGTGKAIIIGGNDGALPSPITKTSGVDIQVWNGSNAWADASANGLLSQPITAFAAASKDPGKFVVAGGLLANGSYETVVQTFTADNDCVVTAGDADTLKLSTNTAIDSGRMASVAFFNGTSGGSDRLYVVGGRDSAVTPAVPLDAQEFLIDWSTPSVAFNASIANVLSTGVMFPELVESGSSNFLLLGGHGNSTSYQTATPLTSNNGQHIEFSGSTPQKPASNAVITLATPRLGHIAQHVGSNWFLATGLSDDSPLTLEVSGEYGTP